MNEREIDMFLIEWPRMTIAGLDHRAPPLLVVDQSVLADIQTTAVNWPRIVDMQMWGGSI
jgi:hypothetical protein